MADDIKQHSKTGLILVMQIKLWINQNLGELLCYF